MKVISSNEIFFHMWDITEVVIILSSNLLLYISAYSSLLYGMIYGGISQFLWEELNKFWGWFTRRLLCLVGWNTFEVSSDKNGIDMCWIQKVFIRRFLWEQRNDTGKIYLQYRIWGKMNTKFDYHNCYIRFIKYILDMAPFVALYFVLPQGVRQT